MASMYHEPAPTSHPFCASIRMKIYHCPITGSSRENQLKIDVFDPICESWEQLDSHGDTHMAEHSGACASVANNLYTFSGMAEKSRYDSLHKLDTTTMRWSYIRPRSSSVCPSAKTGCRMIPLPGNRLALFGGYTQKVVKKKMNPFQKNRTSGGTCNELHIFHIDSSEWTAPDSHGDKPPPCSNFSMNGVDDKRAVMFGGTARDLPRSDELYIIHWDSMIWRKIPRGGPWPDSRKAHAACCLNYGKPNPLILMSGGKDAKDNKLRDLWLLNVNQRRWRQFEDLPLARSGHVLMAFALSDNLVEVTLFGGSDQNEERLSHTCILRFKSEGGEDDWELTNIIGPGDVGRPIARIQEKMESIQPSSSHSVSSSVGSDRPQGQPQSGDDTQKCPKMKDLANHVAAAIPNRWKQVAYQLELTRGEIGIIESNPNERFMAVMEQWQRSAKLPFTWETLITALEEEAVNEIALAKKLKQMLR